ncbi:MAG: DUF11 domain-containing protein [Comamonadaceae bacterium]|nr:MAG: DUF11 domain-containing protein [Comamonadaceae bacterium]
MKPKAHWRKALRVASAALAVALSTLLPAAPAAAAPAAGTVIGNQASATYTDGSGTSRSTTSNLVQTTVSQVKSFTLTADGARTAAPGQTVYYPHVITNTGNGTDTYALAGPGTGGGFTHTSPAYYTDANGDGVPDNAVAITTSGAVAAGAQFRFVVAAAVPGSATLGATGTLAVTVNDTGSNTASNTDTTTVAASAVGVTKSMSVTSGASPSAANITVTLAYTNAGTAAASNLVLTDMLPAGMSYVTGTGSWSGQALTDAAAGDPAGISYAYTIATKQVAATIASVPAGGSGQVTFQVTVNAGLSPTNSTLGTSCTTAGCPALTTNTATFQTASQGLTSTNSVVYLVQQSGSVVLNGSSGSNAAGAGEPVTAASAPQGGTASFPVYAWNTGNGSDTVNISNASIGTFPAGTTFQVFRGDGTTPLIDTNGDGIVDTGPLAAGGSMALVVRATLPTTGATGNNGGAGFTVTFTASSAFAPASTESTTLRLDSITANAVDATVNTAVPAATVAEGLGSTGTTVVQSNNVTPAQGAATTAVFSIYVNNTGGAADSYDIALQNALPAGWNVAFRAAGGASCATTGAALTTTGSIAAGANRLICAVVTVPSIQSGNAAPGNRTLEVRAQSASTTGSNDVVTVQVAVQTVHAVSLSPNGMQQTYPAAAVTYSHTLANIGNVSESTSFAAGFLGDSQQVAGWTSTAYLDTNSNGALDLGTDTLLATGSSVLLGVGQSRTIFVRVFAPASATSSNPANVTTLTATYDTSATTSATDTTGITEGLLLLKEQVSTGCSTVPAGGYSSSAIAASAATAPGACIGYRITATNTTAQTISNVQVSDTVPANTLLHTACGAPAGSAGVTPGGTAADGTGGTVTATAASLAPTASFTATFCVRINP